MEIIGNWAYAGTQKFVSHALSDDGSKTLCGLVVAESMARKGQQWEYETSTAVGCLRCKSRLAKRATDSGYAPAKPAESTPETKTVKSVLVERVRYR